ncbi:MAG: hypothetical protein DDT36_01751 [Firmicutes bacterium]|nr:hypothetical protein [Bacillota bacterium]
MATPTGSPGARLFLRRGGKLPEQENGIPPRCVLSATSDSLDLKLPPTASTKLSPIRPNGFAIVAGAGMSGSWASFRIAPIGVMPTKKGSPPNRWDTAPTNLRPTKTGLPLAPAGTPPIFFTACPAALPSSKSACPIPRVLSLLCNTRGKRVIHGLCKTV